MDIETRHISVCGADLQIIGTDHGGQNPFSSREKNEEILESVKDKLNRHNPGTVFIEFPPEHISNLSNFTDPHRQATEAVAVNNYVSNTNANVVGVDSQDFKDLYGGDTSEDMRDFVNLARNNPLAYNTVNYLMENNVRKATLVIGENHIGGVMSILKNVNNS